MGEVVSQLPMKLTYALKLLSRDAARILFAVPLQQRSENCQLSLREVSFACSIPFQRGYRRLLVKNVRAAGILDRANQCALQTVLSRQYHPLPTRRLLPQFRSQNGKQVGGRQNIFVFVKIHPASAHRTGTRSPQSRAAYFRAVQSGCSRHAWKSASLRVDAKASQAVSNFALACSKLSAQPQLI